jgi:hypothetical protein
MSHARIDDRYELLDEMPHVTGGRFFRARDLAFGQIVGVKQLGPNCGLEADLRDNLENLIRHLQSLSHPHLTRVHSFDAARGLLVQEWVQGVSLLDLLRRRRELGLGEALSLLARLPATLDFLAREAVPPPRPLLGKLYVELPEGVVADSVAAIPVDRWPAFRLKLNPLSLRGKLSGPDTDETTHTVIVDPRQPTDIQDGYGPRELALLLYELLGGRTREVDSRRYVPLGALGEAGNAVLRRELLAMPHADCESLWRELLQTQSLLARAPQPAEPAPAGATAYRIPAEGLATGHAGSALHLESSDPGAVSIHLVARPRFAVGRSTALADLAVRVLPESETNDARTHRLSRVHSLLEIADGQIVVRDGNGSGPSLNGSTLDGQPLTPNHPTALSGRARLILGAEYALDLIPVERVEPQSWTIENIGAWNGPAERPALAPFAALVCEPALGHGQIAHGVWLFSEAGFGLDTAGRLVWDTRGSGTSPAAFHYYRGCFWLRNSALTVPVLVGADTVLGHGEITPITTGQTIRLGPHTYTVEIE